MPRATDRARPNTEALSGVVEQLSGGYRTVGEMVYAVLKEAILSGVFAPGERLRQESLAEAIGVSRIPVRSALLQLEAEGIITFHPHRGARVRTLSVDQVDEIFRLRRLLEGDALAQSSSSLTPERADELLALARELDDAALDGDFLDRRIRFYRALYDHERNPLLVELIEDLRARLGRYYLTMRLDGHNHDHVALVQLLAAGQLDRAQSWLGDHLDQVRDFVREVITADQ